MARVGVRRWLEMRRGRRVWNLKSVAGLGKKIPNNNAKAEAKARPVNLAWLGLLGFTRLQRPHLYLAWKLEWPQSNWAPFPSQSWFFYYKFYIIIIRCWVPFPPNCLFFWVKSNCMYSLLFWLNSNKAI